MTQDQAKISAETRNYPLVSTDYSLVQSTNHTSIVSKLEQQSIAKQFETSENVKGIKEMHNQEVGAINITNEPGTANESKGVKTNSVIQATTTMVSREHLEPSKQKETVKTPQSIHLGSDKLQRVIESQTANAMVYKESQTSSINQVPTAMVPKDLMGAINQNEIAGITEKIIVDIEHLHRQTVWQQDTSMVSKNVNMKSMNQPEITMAYNDVCSSAFNSLETATPSQNIKCDIDEVDERTHQKAGTGLVSKDFSVDILNQQGVSDTTQRIYMTGDEQYEETHERTGTAIISKDFHGDVLARSS